MVGNVEISCAHYLIEIKISWYPTHILSSVITLIPLLVLRANKQKKKKILPLVSINLYEIKYMMKQPFIALYSAFTIFG
jgi:hypothetical protein